jgi:hypothetical protein
VSQKKNVQYTEEAMRNALEDVKLGIPVATAEKGIKFPELHYYTKKSVEKRGRSRFSNLVERLR